MATINKTKFANGNANAINVRL